MFRTAGIACEAVVKHGPPVTMIREEAERVDAESKAAIAADRKRVAEARERAERAEAQAAEGKNIKHDIAVPISSIAGFIRSTNAALASRFPGIRMVVLGHLGDGNLHYNVPPPADQTGPEHEEAFLALQPEINLITHPSTGEPLAALRNPYTGQLLAARLNPMGPPVVR